MTQTEAPPSYPTFAEAARAWTKIALLSFGGPAGQIAIMHRVLVEERRWIGERRFLHALNYCMLLPGPEAQQLATYVGWLLHGLRGGLLAGLLFILPGFLSILALSFVYVLLGDAPAVEGLFFGLKAAVAAVVAHAVVRIGRRAVKGPWMLALAAGAFIALFVFGAPFPLVILTAGVAGLIGARLGLKAFTAAGHGSAGDLDDARSALGETMPAHARPGAAWSLKVSAVFLALWLAPVGALFVWLGPDDVFTRIAVFFSQTAVVTFGGAYAVLAYVAQQAVETYGWLRPGEMLDGLGMAETTPGPLIQVLQFVAFLAAWREATGTPPLVAAALASVLATWVTFTPCFLWIFAGAPWVERLSGNRVLSGALAAITAAVAGVILNLSVWFALHLVFPERRLVEVLGRTFEAPVWAQADLAAAALALLAGLALFSGRAGVITVLATSAAAGVALRLTGLA